MAKTKTSGLGRGLDSIFFDNSPEETAGNGITVMRLSEIEPNPDQPRKEFDTESLTMLADSIAANGLIQPLVVRHAMSDGYYQIIAGERRWRAAKMAGLTEVPVIVMDADDKKASELALIENVQREDLNPIEEATAIAVLLDTYGITQEELSRSIGKSRSAIANAIRLLELPAEVIVMIKTGALSAGHGKALLGLKDPERILPLAKFVADKELNVRACEELVRRENRPAPEETDAQEEEQPLVVDYISALAEKMTHRMGREIKIRHTPKLRRLEISYEDDEDLDKMVRLLCGENIWDEE